MGKQVSEKGKIFTRYSIVIVVIIVMVAGLLFLLGDFVYSQIWPAQPTITYPLPDTTVSENPPTFEGSLPLSAAIKIYIDGEEVTTRNPQAQALWTFTPEQQLEIGKHTIYAVAVSREGLKSKKTDEITFYVPKRPQITNIYDGEQLQSGQLIFEGEAAPDTEINLYIDDQFIQSTKSDVSGKWAFNSLPEMRPGTHKVHVTAVKTIGEFGNISEVLSFTIQNPLPRQLQNFF